jgi:hypothetical protein
MSEPIRHDDLNELRGKRFRVPAIFQHGAWLALPVGHSTAPDIGPSGTRILLWLPRDAPTPAAWTEIEKAIGAARGPTSRTAPARAMSALVPEGSSLDRTVEGDRWIIRGIEYPTDAFGNIFWKHGWALGTDAGLLVSLERG